MNIPFLCVFLAFIMNYLTKLPVAMAMAKSNGGYDNSLPRDQQASLTGWGKRALGAHLNSFEISPAFAAAVIIAHLASVSAMTLSLLSIIFIASRLLYIILYLADLSTLRSTVWFIGLICVATIFSLAIF